MQKLLFVCNDYIGKTMAGPGIRSWEMACALTRKGHQTAVLARYSASGFSRDPSPSIGTASFLNLITQIRRSDIVIQPGSPLALFFSVLFRRKIIFDQYDPVIFEFLEHHPAGFAARLKKRVMLLLWRIRQRLILRFGSGFLVANEKQKDLLIGQLSALGHLDKLASVVVLPFGLPETKPVKRHAVIRGTKIKESDFLLVWGGGIWDWFDPFTLLEALAKIAAQRPDIKVYFPGINPPSPDSRKLAVVEEFLAQARKLDLLDTTVFVNRDWTPYEERADYLLEADAGISLHRDSLETRFAFRTRMLDYLWAGLPVIASRGDCWAEEIDRRGLGITVACGDVDATARAVVRMADDKGFRRECSARVKALGGEYSWDALAERIRL